MLAHMDLSAAVCKGVVAYIIGKARAVLLYDHIGDNALSQLTVLYKEALLAALFKKQRNDYYT